MHLYLHMDVFVLHPRRPSTKCMSPRRNGWRRSVPATKWLATKCPRDEMPGDEVSTRRNGWQRSVHGTKWQVSKRRRQNGMYPCYGLYTAFRYVEHDSARIRRWVAVTVRGVHRISQRRVCTVGRQGFVCGIMFINRLGSKTLWLCFSGGEQKCWGHNDSLWIRSCRVNANTHRTKGLIVTHENPFGSCTWACSRSGRVLMWRLIYWGHKAALMMIMYFRNGW